MRTLICLLALCGAAHAQVTLVYTGQPMGQNTAVGTVTLAQPLGANGTQVVTPLSYSLTINTDFAFTYDVEANSTPTFSFTTVNGVITAWDIFVQNQLLATAVVALTVTDKGDEYDVTNVSPECIRVGCPDNIILNTTPGAWSISQAQVMTAMSSMNSQLATAQTDATSYANGYLAANAIVTELNAFAVAARNTIAACRANAGKC